MAKVTRGILALECVHFEGDEQFLKKNKSLADLGANRNLKCPTIDILLLLPVTLEIDV